MLDLTVVVLSYEDVRRQMARGARVVDVRTPQEYVYLHLNGAIPLAAPRFGFPILSSQHLTFGERVIVVAQSPVNGQVAAREIDALGIDVIGIFASLPRTWEGKGLKVQLGELVFPDQLSAYVHAHPDADLVDLREPIEVERFPFSQVTRRIPFSSWPEGGEELDSSRPIIFISGRDDRSIIAARDTMVRGFPRVGYLVGGFTAYQHPRTYDPKEAARTTAHHGVFI